MYTQKSIVKILGKCKNSYTLTEKQWTLQQLGKILCPQCYKLRRHDVFPTKFDVPIRQLPLGTTYDILFRGPGGIIHDSLLNFLLPYLKNYSIGMCLSHDGYVMTNYRSIYLLDTVQIRGNRSANYYVCNTCGIISGGWGDQPYVLRKEIPDAEVFQDDADGLFLDENLARIFPWKQFVDQEPFVIPVRDEPLSDDPYPG